MPERDDALEHVLVSLSSLVVDRQSATDTLSHIASLARDGIGPADYAAVTTLREGRPETAVPPTP